MRGYLAEHVLMNEHISCIHEDAIVARGHGYALVHCLIDTCVGLAHPFCDMLLVLTDDFDRPIRACPIHHDVFVGRVILLDDRFDGLRHTCSSIEGNGNDGYLHEIS